MARENLISLGTCFGKFTKTRKFRLHVTALDFLAPYAQYKIWLKASAEQQFLYGHNVSKSGLGRITENTEKYQVLINDHNLHVSELEYFTLILVLYSKTKSLPLNSRESLSIQWQTCLWDLV